MTKLPNAALKRATALIFHLNLLEVLFFAACHFNVDESHCLRCCQKSQMKFYRPVEKNRSTAHIGIQQTISQAFFMVTILPVTPYPHSMAGPLAPKRKTGTNEDRGIGKGRPPTLSEFVRDC